MRTESNAVSNRLMKLTKNTNELRGKVSSARDDALVKDMDALIQKLTELKAKFETMVTSVVAPGEMAINAVLEERANLLLGLKGDETFLAERL